MGCVSTIDFDKFPKQSDRVGTEVTVYFKYDTSRSIKAKIIRDDAEIPFRTMFQLENGNVILDTECQYQPAPRVKKIGTIRIRMHRGGLDDSIKTMEEIPATKESVLVYLCKHDVLRLNEDSIKVEPYFMEPDERIDWNVTLMVRDATGIIAYTDGPVE